MLSGVSENKELVEISDANDPILLEAEAQIPELARILRSLELKKMLSDEADRLNAIVSINAGSGGTEAQDWAQILQRMLLRYAHKKNYSVELVDEQAVAVAPQHHVGADAVGGRPVDPELLDDRPVPRPGLGRAADVGDEHIGIGVLALLGDPSEEGVGARRGDRGRHEVEPRRHEVGSQQVELAADCLAGLMIAGVPRVFAVNLLILLAGVPVYLLWSRRAAVSD